MPSHPPVPSIPGAKPSTGSNPPAGGFHGLSDDEWSSLLKAPPPPPNPYDKPAKSGSAAKALKAASKGNEEEKKEKKKSAASFLNSSRGLLIFMGVIKIAFSLYYFLQAKKTAETIIGSDPDLAEGSEMIVFILQLIHGVGIATGTCFIILGLMVFLLPLTSTISALALFVIIEAIGLLLNPIALFDLYGWILRVAIGGALVQAINNAAFYKFARAAAKAKN